MLPPIPHSLAPVTAQQDVVKPRPDIAPVTPTNESANESSVGLDKRHPQEAEELLREEQRRRQRQRQAAGGVQETDESEEESQLEDLPRQGLWVDVEV